LLFLKSRAEPSDEKKITGDYRQVGSVHGKGMIPCVSQYLLGLKKTIRVRLRNNLAETASKVVDRLHVRDPVRYTPACILSKH
jgi:hypothetical protein